MSVFRVFIEKSAPANVEAIGVFSDLIQALSLKNLTGVRILNRYDAQGLSQSDFDLSIMTVFGEPQLDTAYLTMPETKGTVLAIELLAGQFDQRADSASQCIQLCTGKTRPIIKTAKVFILEGEISVDELAQIKNYLINPVESREANLAPVDTLEDNFAAPSDVLVIDGFINMDDSELITMLADYSLAMDKEDLTFCQNYFKSENRNPTITEIRVIDTYWSDHCRHTTFATELSDISFDSGASHIKASYDRYLRLRQKVGRDTRPITLMDLATIGAKALSQEGLLEALDVSEEINACSVKIDVDVDGVLENWLLMFKNETHNHPTEIEPFGGAATCLGGAIRDPLSGRAYVYQAMRVTGAGNPLTPVNETLIGKLPQRKIVTKAAAGYSSYGNQIGLTTGLVEEIYDDGYTAKRMEVGAVIAAVKAENVVRERPKTGNVIVLLGGATGRDGCGGATGSSKSHTTDSLAICGAEVQKGNAPEERKIQRLFRNSEASRMILRCNDFGAGGVSVAVGELADSLLINLDAVPKKYEGLDGTELAISESQERMAVVLDKSNVDRFIALANAENLNAVAIATVTDDGYMKMTWRGATIASLSRAFLDTNGAVKKASANVISPISLSPAVIKGSLNDNFVALAQNINVTSQKGLVERFDCSVGASNILAPFGGTYKETPIQSMVAKIPVMGETDTCSIMSYGFSPTISERDPFGGAVCAVLQSVAKVVSAGGSRKNCWLSFQEYFEKLGQDPTKWGKPFSALLGALDAQMELECGAIGGKDSMSGTFNDISVPPTLISFAVSTSTTKNIISPEFKKAGNIVAVSSFPYSSNGIPDLCSAKRILDSLEAEIANGNVKSAWVTTEYGGAEGLMKMSFGNRIGVSLDSTLTMDVLFGNIPASIIVECENCWDSFFAIGKTVSDFSISLGEETCKLDETLLAYQNGLVSVFPYVLSTPTAEVTEHRFDKRSPLIKKSLITKPKVLVCSFPGTNSEYDTARAFSRYGAESEIFVVRNRTADDVLNSVTSLCEKIASSQIIAIPGGFSGGDEPEGSAKLIVAFFRNPMVTEAIRTLLQKDDGLMIGICNGFQALIKLGLVPYGDILDTDKNSPTLTFNRIGRHQSQLITTKISSVASPWMMYHNVGDLHTIPISHGEGRLIVNEELLATLSKNGQIASQYVDLNGIPSLETQFNPNFSVDAIEGLFSPDGRVFGKMAHSERAGKDVFKNISGNKEQLIFKGAVDYFSK